MIVLKDKTGILPRWVTLDMLDEMLEANRDARIVVYNQDWRDYLYLSNLLRLGLRELRAKNELLSFVDNYEDENIRADLYFLMIQQPDDTTVQKFCALATRLLNKEIK